MFRFNRSQLFWYGVAAMFGVFNFYKCFLLMTWKHTVGTVVAYDVQLPNGLKTRLTSDSKARPATAEWAVIEFAVNGRTVDFIAGENLNLTLGSTIPILYEPNDPTKAFVNSFFGLWFRPLMILPLIVWASLVRGLTGKNSIWTVRFFPFAVTRIDIQKRSNEF